VNVRNRDDVGSKARGEVKPLLDVLAQMIKLKKERSLFNKLE
jgi:threonyl-tRNA synthetase